jgi:hypothetical protein
MTFIDDVDFRPPGTFGVFGGRNDMSDTSDVSVIFRSFEIVPEPSTLDAVYIDALSAEVRAGTNDPLFDLNGDGFVDDSDRTTWVRDVAGTFFGDADLNKEVDFADFLALSDAFGGEGGWANGDFDGNGNVDFPDFLALSANFGRDADAAVSAVPEPTGICLAMFSILGLIGFRRRR